MDNISDVLDLAIHTIIYAAAVSTLFLAVSLYQRGNLAVAKEIPQKQSITEVIDHTEIQPEDAVVSASQVLTSILAADEDVAVYVDGLKIDETKRKLAKNGKLSAVTWIKGKITGAKYTKSFKFSAGTDNDDKIAATYFVRKG